MDDAPLVIHVVTQDSMHERMGSGIVIVVDPLYGGPAVALALDSGWASVELDENEGVAPPIPLVSFEQPPPSDVQSGRCRVRSDDLTFVVDQIVDGDHPALLGSVINARPLCSMVATRRPSDVTFVVVPSLGDRIHDLTADAMWAAGMLIRVLLEELDDRPSRLTDAAGIAVTLAQGAEDPAAQLSTGVRWRRHLDRGGHVDDLRIAAAIDSIAAVPRITLEGDSLVARAWLPEPVSSSADA